MLGLVATKAGRDGASEGVIELRRGGRGFGPQGFGGASVALKAVREERGDPVARPNTLRSKSCKRGVSRARVTTITKALDCELGPLITMGQKAADAVALTLLNHRGEPLEAKTSLADRLIEVLGLRGAKVFGASTKFGGKDGVDLLTLTKGPGGENADVGSSGIEAFCHHEVNGPRRRLLDGKGLNGHQKFVLHSAQRSRVRRVYGVFDSKTFESAMGANLGGVGDPPRRVNDQCIRGFWLNGKAAVMKGTEFVYGNGKVENHGAHRDQGRSVL